MAEPISVAIETTCRAGGVALGVGDELIEAADFDASRRAATQVVSRLKDMLDRHGYAPADVDEIYVAVGPGSFTGTRVGVTVARTLGQAFSAIRCVAVPTAAAVVENVADRADLDRLAVILDARRGSIWSAGFERTDAGWSAAGEPRVCTPAEFLTDASTPLAVLGEGLGYHDLAGEGVTILPESVWLPTVTSVWRVGRRMAKAGQVLDYHQVLPIYTGKPEAVRVWEERQRNQSAT